jgi:hypothetical protein
VICPSKLGENPGSLFDKCSARNRATTLWGPPPEPGNRRAGTMATATGGTSKAFARKQFRATASRMSMSSLLPPYAQSVQPSRGATELCADDTMLNSL